jgi:hypothetical protein
MDLSWHNQIATPLRPPIIRQNFRLRLIPNRFILAIKP